MFILFWLLIGGSIYSMQNNDAPINPEQLKNTLMFHIFHCDSSGLKKIQTQLQQLSDQEQKNILESINFDIFLDYSHKKVSQYTQVQYDRLRYCGLMYAINSLLTLSCHWDRLGKGICDTIPTLEKYAEVAYVGAAASTVVASCWYSFRQYQLRKELKKLSGLSKKSD